MASSCHSAENLAYKKTYTVFPAPNYILSIAPNNKNSLTDGKYTRGYFWTQKTTLGWKGVRTVEILIDLKYKSVIDSITFSTARGNHAEVNYPARIDAFVGSNMDKFLYVGDISKNSVNIPGPYQTKILTLNDICATGRYVLLKVWLNGQYIFCDEIEVLKGNNDKGIVGNLTIEGARNISEKLRKLQIEKEFLFLYSKIINISTSTGLNNENIISEIKKRIIKLESINNVKECETELLKIRARVLRTKYPGKDFLVGAINPWESLSLIMAPVDIPQQNISFTVPRGGYDHAAFVVSNLTADTQQISVQPVMLPKEAPKLAIFHVPFVKSAAMEYVADPLVPIKRDFTLRSGESRMVFMTVHGEHTGTWRGALNVVSGGSVIMSLPLNIMLSEVALPKKFTFKSVNWGYLDFKPIRDRKVEAVKDLFAHHTNVIVVPPAYLPLASLEKSINFRQLESYLKLHKGASIILFFVEYNSEDRLTTNGKYQFMSDMWKEGFKNFYSGLVKSAAKVGFSEDQLYLYPYDEIGKENIERFIALSSWTKKEIPSLKYYATLLNKESFVILQYLDIAQIHYLNISKAINLGGMFSDKIDSKKEIWLYNTKRPTKSLSPYSYYRMMSWMAFYHGFTGIGFWNYADTGWGENPGTAWDDFDGARPDFAVIYEGENGSIVSSRRWEAWRMGVEDYELLRMYARAKGDKAAKYLAEMVVNNPLDLGKADDVRRRILRELSE